MLLYQSHGQALGQQLLIALCAHLKMLLRRQQHRRAPQDIHHAQRRRHALCQHRSRSCTRNAQAQPGDEPNIQSHIQHRGQQQKYQGHHAVANGPQQTGTKVIGKHHRHTQGNDADIGIGVPDDLRRGIQQLQQRAQAQQPRQHDGQRGADSNDHRPRHGALEAVLILGAIAPGRHDGQTIADAQAKPHQQLIDRTAGANSSQGLIPQHIAHDHDIYGIVQLLEQAGEKDGQHKQEQAFKDRPAGKLCIQFGQGPGLRFGS